MKPALVASLFAVTVLFQVAVPVLLVTRQEQILQQGEPIKFRTAPVDPYDAFRGRYVRLGFTAWQVPVNEARVPRRGQWIYVRLTNDVEGYSAPAGAATRAPAAGPYLRLRADWVNGQSVSIRPPFDRYYLEEHRAPAAESAYRAANTRTNRDAHIVVRVLKGRGALEDLVIGGQSAKELGR